MLAVLVNPNGYLVELFQFGFTDPVASLLFNRNEAAVNQYLYMQRNSLPGYIKFFCNSIYIVRLCGNHVDDGSSGWIGYSLVNIAPCFHCMQVSACKYKCKRLLAQIFLKKEMNVPDVCNYKQKGTVLWL